MTMQTYKELTCELILRVQCGTKTKNVQQLFLVNFLTVNSIYLIFNIKCYERKDRNNPSRDKKQDSLWQ